MKYKNSLPPIVEAFKYEGKLMSCKGEYCIPEWSIKAFEDDIIFYQSHAMGGYPWELYVNTGNEEVIVDVGDYIAISRDNKIHVYNGKIFEMLYEPIESEGKYC